MILFNFLLICIFIYRWLWLRV